MFTAFPEAAKEETLSAFGPWCADPVHDETRIGARTDKGEKSHQGVASKKSAPYQGIAWSKSTTALGLPGLWLENRNGSRCTGKKRDIESGLDYFGARYYSSALGRFMTPDWSDKPEAVPYASFGNPQSLNLYGYVQNNPMSHADPDGHLLEELKNLWNWDHYVDDAHLNQALQKDADRARASLSSMKGITLHGQSPADFAKNASNQDVIRAQRATVELFLHNALQPCGSAGAQCGVVFPLDAAPEAEGVAESQGLARQLTSEEQFGQALAGKGTPVLGAGTSKELRDADRLAKQYRGSPSEWAKMSSSSSAGHGVTLPNGNNFETHWYQNVKTGMIVEIKTKISGH